MLGFSYNFSFTDLLVQSNLGLILQSYGDYENALKFMEKSLELNKKWVEHGKENQNDVYQ